MGLPKRFRPYNEIYYFNGLRRAVVNLLLKLRGSAHINNNNNKKKIISSSSSFSPSSSQQEEQKRTCQLLQREYGTGGPALNTVLAGGKSSTVFDYDEKEKEHCTK
jgi:hypothetical protein